MPLYTYIDLRSGEHVTMMKPIADRDRVPGHERIFEPPTAVKVINPSAGSPLDLQAEQVMTGYRRLEERGELNRSKYTPDQIKNAWQTPLAPAPAETT